MTNKKEMPKCKMCEQPYDTHQFSELCLECFTIEYMTRHRENLEVMGLKIKDKDVELFGGRIKRRAKL